LKTYHFGGSYSAIDECIFDQLKARHLERQKELVKLNELDEFIFPTKIIFEKTELRSKIR